MGFKINNYIMKGKNLSNNLKRNLKINRKFRKHSKIRKRVNKRIKNKILNQMNPQQKKINHGDYIINLKIKLIKDLFLKILEKN